MQGLQFTYFFNNTVSATGKVGYGGDILIHEQIDVKYFSNHCNLFLFGPQGILSSVCKSVCSIHRTERDVGQHLMLKVYVIYWLTNSFPVRESSKQICLTTLLLLPKVFVSHRSMLWSLHLSSSPMLANALKLKLVSRYTHGWLHTNK